MKGLGLKNKAFVSPLAPQTGLENGLNKPFKIPTMTCPPEQQINTIQKAQNKTDLSIEKSKCIVKEAVSLNAIDCLTYRGMRDLVQKKNTQESHLCHHFQNYKD